jgi:hypothetical protein
MMTFKTPSARSQCFWASFFLSNTNCDKAILEAKVRKKSKDANSSSNFGSNRVAKKGKGDHQMAKGTSNRRSGAVKMRNEGQVKDELANKIERNEEEGLRLPFEVGSRFEPENLFESRSTQPYLC